jgi:DNA-binding NtrC family response regulator
MAKSNVLEETVEQRRDDLFEPPPNAFVLRVTAGVDRGVAFQFDGGQPPVLAGQSPACAVRLGDREVSRRHASFEVAGGRVRVTDLGSTNGTFVDGVAVVDAYVRPGQSLQLGATTLVLEAAAPAANRAPVMASSFGRMLGRSAAMRRLYPIFTRLASANVPVIIEGETGTGKELLAESLHELGPRAAGPFVVLDCGALPAEDVERELFGREGGSPGIFEQANGGTLLIDEIGDLDLAIQPKLLRVLDRGEIVRMGGNQPIRIDVRVIAATHRNLDRDIQTGRFREDLFHRIAVARVELPPLRKRAGDIALLAMHFGGGRLVNAGADAALLSRWEDDPWPGNVRALRNAVTRHLMLGDVEALSVASVASRPDAGQTMAVGQFVAEAVSAGRPLAESRQRIVEAFERLYIDAVLAKHGGHVLKAASEAGVARRYFQILKARSPRP